MELMERIKAECEENLHDCANCRLNIDGTRCMIAHYAPHNWDIEAIRKALEETIDKASDKKEIDVPNMWKEEKLEEMPFGEPYDMVHDVMRKQNAIIYCLEQIKEKLK